MDTKSLSYPIIPELIGWIQRIEILGVIKNLVWIKNKGNLFCLCYIIPGWHVGTIIRQHCRLTICRSVELTNTESEANPNKGSHH